MSANLVQNFYDKAQRDPYDIYDRPAKLLTVKSVAGATGYGFLVFFFAVFASMFVTMSNPALGRMIAVASAVSLIGVWVALAFSRQVTRFDRLILIVFCLLQGASIGALVQMLSMTTIGTTSGSSIVLQAVFGTVAVFLSCLFLYGSGMVRIEAGSRAQRILYTLISASAIFSILNLGATLFLGKNFLWGGGILPLVFGIVSLGIAAFSLIDDFGRVEDLERSGADDKLKYRMALSLISSIVWVFIEILRILVAVASRRS